MASLLRMLKFVILRPVATSQLHANKKFPLNILPVGSLKKQYFSMLTFVQPGLSLQNTPKD